MTVRRVRLYANLRTAHLERFAHMEPAVVLFSKTRYDFDESAAPVGVDLRRVSRAAVLWTLLRERFDVVEVNEPLVSNRWLDLLLQIGCVRTRALMTRRRARVVAYCIGNADPALELAARWRLPVPLARVIARVCVRVLVRAMDRLAFGTKGSLHEYEVYADRAALARRARMFEAVPSACTCLTVDEPASLPADVLFVGAFADHKGITQLMTAWDELHRSRPELRLRLIGKGPRADVVTAWAAGRDDVDLDVDPPRRDIHAALRTAEVLVLLSQPSGAWREQIGLPILEGLSHGCEIVTTTETGLAELLAEHGHRVLEPGATAPLVAAAIVSAVDSRRSRADLLAALPASDQRVAADSWLLAMGIDAAVFRHLTYMCNIAYDQNDLSRQPDQSRLHASVSLHLSQ